MKNTQINDSHWCDTGSLLRVKQLKTTGNYMLYIKGMKTCGNNLSNEQPAMVLVSCFKIN